MSLFLLEPVAKPEDKQQRKGSFKKNKQKKPTQSKPNQNKKKGGGTNPKLLPVFLVIAVTEIYYTLKNQLKQIVIFQMSRTT